MTPEAAADAPAPLAAPLARFTLHLRTLLDKAGLAVPLCLLCGEALKLKAGLVPGPGDPPSLLHTSCAKKLAAPPKKARAGREPAPPPVLRTPDAAHIAAYSAVAAAGGLAMACKPPPKAPRAFSRPSFTPELVGPPIHVGGRFLGAAVPDWGSISAKIILVGESPGRSEDIKGIPFVGPSGHKLFGHGGWADGVGLKREDFYITNVWPHYPGKGGVEQIAKTRKAEWKAAVEALHTRLATLSDPWLIIPTGSYALQAITAMHPQQAKITKWRGSIVGYQDLRGRVIKMIPTMHPAHVIRDLTLDRVARLDWARIGQEAQRREIPGIKRMVNVDPTLADIDAWLAEVKAHPDWVIAVDIETPKAPPPDQRRILCVGFAHRSDAALVVPTLAERWGKRRLEEEVWPRIKAICELPNPKALHNGFYDQYWLWGQHGIKLVNWVWDTLQMHHALDALDQAHSLAYCASVDTIQPYWKDDDKAWVTTKQVTRFAERLLRYNAIDVCVTHELQAKYAWKLKQRNLTNFYFEHYVAWFEPILAMMAAGYRQDVPGRAALAGRLRAANEILHKQLQEMNGGVPLAGAKGSLSTQRLQEFFFGKLGIPLIKSRKTGNPTTDEVALKRVAQKGEEPAASAARLCLVHRGNDKVMQWLAPETLDPDGYFRGSYSPTTDGGRLRGNASPYGTGGNQMNINRRLRYLCVPDEGHILLEIDLSQIQSRLVMVRTRAQRLIDKARCKPGEGPDEHSELAKKVYGPRWEAAPKEYRKEVLRQTAKAGRYLSLFDGGAGTLCDTVLKQSGIFLTLREGEAILVAAHADQPELADWHRRVRLELLSTHRLVNSFGRQWDVRQLPVTHDTYKAGYAFLAQSDEVHIMNTRGLGVMHRWFQANPVGRINGHNHDALIMSVKPDHVWDAAKAFFDSMERPVLIDGTEMTPWCEVKIGRAWGDEPAVPEARVNTEKRRVNTKDWKRLPGREEMVEAARGLLHG